MKDAKAGQFQTYLDRGADAQKSNTKTKKRHD
jgi:hypothetical protein